MFLCCTAAWGQNTLPWENGKPFFWLGDTRWLMPERLNRDEVSFYLQSCKKARYNVYSTDYKCRSCNECVWSVFHDRWFQF